MEGENRAIIAPLVRAATRWPWVPAVCFAISLVAGISLSMNSTPVYSASLKVRYSGADGRTSSIVRTLSEMGQIPQSSGFKSQPHIINSPTVIARALELSGLATSEQIAKPEFERTISDYRSRLSVRVVEDTEILDIGFVGPSRENVLGFLHGLLQAYTSYDMELASRDDDATINGLQDSITEETKNADRLKERVDFDTMVLDLRRALTANDVELERIAGTREKLKLKADAALQAYLKKYGPSYPSYQKDKELLEAQVAVFMTQSVDELKSLKSVTSVDENARNAQLEYLRALDRRADIENKIAALIASSKRIENRAAFDAFHVDEGELHEKASELTASRASIRRSRDALLPLLAKRKASSSRVSELNSPRDAAASPKWSTTTAVMIALLGGSVFSILALGLLAASRRGFGSLEELEAGTTESILAVLPYMKDGGSGPVIPERGTHYAWTDRFGQLAYRLVAKLNKERIRVAVCSALPSEGKSTVVVNLCNVLGRSGRKVLLVDGNLRRPSCSLALGIPPDSKGLFQFVTEGARLYECVCPTQTANVDIMPPGTKVNESTEYLSRTELLPFFEEMSKHYDAVIFDTPPQLLVADSTIMAHATDGIILVHAVGSSRRADLYRSLRQFHEDQVPIIGIVANERSKSSFVAPQQAFGYVSDAKSATASGANNGSGGGDLELHPSGNIPRRTETLMTSEASHPRVTTKVQASTPISTRKHPTGIWTPAWRSGKEGAEENGSDPKGPAA